jgi:DnaJ-class molecular chaperone
MSPATKPECPGCAGTGTIQVRVQTRLKGRRFCHTQIDPCPICQGTGQATEAEAEAWFAREFPEVDDQGERHLP